jgi:hypothetical protein
MCGPRGRTQVHAKARDHLNKYIGRSVAWQIGARGGVTEG